MLRVRRSNHYIYNLIHNEDLDILIAGQTNGQIVQIDLGNSRNSGRVTKKFLDLNINAISYTLGIGRLGIFGGYNGELKFVDLFKRVIVTEVIKTSIDTIRFMTICPIICKEDSSKTKVFLCVSGVNCSYVNGLTDVFDITKLLKKAGVSCSVIENYKEI